VLEQMGLRVLRTTQADEVEETVSAALDAVFGAGEQVAVLLSQRLIGRQRWVRD
jgi:hypothetical protein